jgi:hypothetical protein
MNVRDLATPMADLAFILNGNAEFRQQHCEGMPEAGPQISKKVRAPVRRHPQGRGKRIAHDAVRYA